MWEFGWVEYVHGPYEIGRILLEIAVYYVNRRLMCSVVEMWLILTKTTRKGRESMSFYVKLRVSIRDDAVQLGANRTPTEFERKKRRGF